MRTLSTVLAVSLALALPAYAADLSNATVQSIQQGTVAKDGNSCLYVQVFIPSEAQAQFLRYTLSIAKLGDLTSAMIINTHRNISFDFAAVNTDCTEFPAFDGALGIVRPSSP